MAHAKLIVYGAVCPADGCQEFDATVDGRNHYWKQAISLARRMVEERYMDQQGLRIRSDLVRHAQDAPTLIQLVEHQIPNSNGMAEILTCKDGEILFQRLVRLTGWTAGQQEELVERLQQIGYEPWTPEREQLDYLLKNEHASQGTKDFARKMVDKADPNVPWRKALQFCE